MITDSWSIERFLKKPTRDLLQRLSGNHEAQLEYFSNLPLHEHVTYKRTEASVMYTTGLLSWLMYLVEDGELPASYTAAAYLLQKYDIRTFNGVSWRLRVLQAKLPNYGLKQHWMHFQTPACIPYLMWRKYARREGVKSLKLL